MSFIDDLKRWANGDDEEEETLEEFTPARSARREREEEDKTSTVTDFRRSANNKVVNINATTQLSVVLVKPDKYENAPEIADHLRERRTVVINLEQTNKDVAKRLIDFLSGVAYAQEGKIKKVANSTYMITPYNVNILGDLIDELENNGLYI
ncbi:MAG: cell division protein SepF [Butyricicoccaceae bacterium]|nr:cell division protein SepF [Clostridia bacterium]